jgi:hypothetical protein
VALTPRRFAATARDLRRHALPTVSTFDDVSGAQLTDVALPRDPASAPRSRTVQATVSEELRASPPVSDRLLRVATVPRARLAYSSGAVITQRGELVMETLWDQEHWLRDFNPPEELPAPVKLAGRYASLISPWSHNFFHWMFEALPRLAVLRASGVQYDGVLVPSPLSQFHQDTLALVGVPAEERVPFAGNHVAPDELVWAAPLAPIGFPTPYLVQWLSNVLGGGEVSAPYRRIYLARRHSRRVVNESAVLRALRPWELELIYPEELSFRDQVELFSATSLMIGPHGAGFGNAIFSPSATALEFYQPAHVNPSITGVFAAAGHEHWSLVGRRVPALARREHHNVWVPVGDLTKSLAQLGAAVGDARQ